MTIAVRRSEDDVEPGFASADNEPMTDALAAYTLALALAVALCLGLSFLGFARREIAGALPLALLLIASALYALGSIFEIRSDSVGGSSSGFPSNISGSPS